MDLTRWVEWGQSTGITLAGICCLAYAVMRGMIKIVREEAAAWKSRYESEHGEFVAYRERVHAKANTDNATILDLTQLTSELKAKTDLTPIYQQLREQTEQLSRQTEINQQVEKALTEIAASMRAQNGKHAA